MISNNSLAVSKAVKDFVNTNVEIKRLLVINSIGQPINSAPEEDLQYADSLTYDELIDLGYIIYEIEADTLDKNKEKVHCRLSVGVSDSSVDFTVFCDYKYWHLDNFRTRPIEIQKIIYETFNGMEGIFSKKLEYLSCYNRAIREDVGAVMAIYNEQYSIDDENEEDDNVFPLNHYDSILHVVVNRLVNNTDINKYIGRGEADGMSVADFIDKGYIRFAQNIRIDKDDEPKQYLLIYLEDSVGLQINFDIISNKSTSILSDGTDRNKHILKCIKDAMKMIPGVAPKGSHSTYELNEDWTLFTVLFGVDFSEETLTTVIDEKNWERVKPRFFADVDTLNELLDLELTDEEFASNDIQDLHVDLIDIPYYIRLVLKENGKEMTVYDRSETCVSYKWDGTVKGNLTISETGEAKGTASEGTIGENLGAFFKACLIISKYYKESGLAENIDFIDFDEEGYILTVSDGRLVFNHVSGWKRPNMMCSSLFNPPRMMRPYMNEISGASMGALEGEDGLLSMAEAEDESAMISLAELYAKGDEKTEINPEKAFYWYKKASELNNPTAQYNLGQFYLRGFGTERDFEKAIYWMKKAAENGDEDAADQVRVYEKTFEAAMNAEKGDASSQAEYARFLMNMGKTDSQINGNQDFVESIKWAKKAAEQGNAEAFWILALAYEHGWGVEEDRNKAIELYTKGVEFNHPDSMNSLAAFISRREVPGKTKEDAFELIKKAAEMGNVLAMRNLGHSYQFAEGTGYDMEKAIFWYEKYLAHTEDEELAQKVMFFKMMPELLDGASSDEDYDKVDPSEFKENLTEIEFKDKIFVLTGFDTIEENRITKIITDRGGVIKSSTVLKTDYLVVMGDYSSRKYDRAVELNKQGKNIAIISIEQFYKLMR